MRAIAIIPPIVMCDMNENMSRSTIGYYFDIRDNDDLDDVLMRNSEHVIGRLSWRLVAEAKLKKNS